MSITQILDGVVILISVLAIILAVREDNWTTALWAFTAGLGYYRLITLGD